MKIDQGSGVLPSRDKVVGYVNTMQFVESLAVQIAQDQQQMELVKFIETALTNGATLLKQWIDALSKQAGQGLSQEEQAKADSVVQQAQTKMAIEAADAEQKRRHSEISFQQQLQRNRETLQHELEATDMRAAADVATKRMKADEQAKP